MQSAQTGEKGHLMTLRDRTNMSLTGVTDVPSFCEQTIVAATVSGDVTIIGEEMHISRLNLDEGQVEIEGTIHAVEYAAHAQGRKGVFGRLWK